MGKFVREPEQLKGKMDAFRMGCDVLPQEYVGYHERSARRDLKARDLKARGWKLLDVGLVRDGGMDGMLVIEARVAIACFGEGGVRMRWHETGAWFLVHGTGGSTRYAEAV